VLISGKDTSWPEQMNQALQDVGYFILADVLLPDFIEATKAAMRRAQVSILETIDQSRLAAAGELGILRLMMQFDPHFFRFLEIPELLTIVDQTVGSTAILHLQNGFILPSFDDSKEIPLVSQNRFHRDFPRYLNGYRASINVLFAIDDFREETGATWVLPGSQQQAEKPGPAAMPGTAIPMLCPAGSLIVFDSTLWHAAGDNRSGRDRYAINHQFTPSFFKQQIDYVRALDETTLLSLPPRSQQLLGYYTRVVTSLDEYYQPEKTRLYRKGQG
jgi:ectoine hydroxylase-related dioxygenase (phytanoyl-CoA dioxygenase family)